MEAVPNSELSSAATVTTAVQGDRAQGSTLAGEKRPPSSSLESAATSTAPVPSAASSNAQVTVLLLLGNLAIVELEGGNGRGSAITTPSAFTTADDGAASVRVCAVVGGDGDGDDTGVTADAESGETERRLLRLEERIEILHCRGMSRVYCTG